MKNGRTVFLLVMGMMVSLYTAFVVIGQDVEADMAEGEEGAAAEDAAGDAPEEGAEAAPAAVPEAAEPPPAKPEPPKSTPVQPTAGADVVAGGVIDPADEDSDSVFVGVEDDKGEISGAEGSEANTEGVISINLDNVEMVDVVSMFTRISGANIIASPSNLVGRVTAHLEEVHWQSAMQTILDMHNLALLESPPGSKIFRIDSKVAGAPPPLKVKTFFLKYAAVSNSTDVIRAMLAPGASVQPFASRNALVIRSTVDNLGEIAEIIEAIDVLRDQVFIEAKFLELNDTAIKDLGINWQVLQGFSIGAGSLNWSLTENRDWSESNNESRSRNDDRRFTDQVVERYDIDNVQIEDSSTSYEEAPPGSGVYVPVTTVVPTRSVDDVIDRGQSLTSDLSDEFSKSVADVRTAVLGVDDFRLVLSALRQMDGVQVVSNPKIIVANEELATIHIGEEERPFEATVTPATTTTAPIVTYNPGAPVQLGVKLHVTPTINTESNITVRIEPELTRFVRNSVAPNGQTYPIIGKKTIKTSFCLESGKTVAIGGLTETIELDSVKKVPLLGDIPLIGKYLFTHEHREKQQKETIIFVTVGLAVPESVNEMDGLPANTELTHKRLLDNKMRRLEFNEQLEKDRQRVEERLQESQRVRQLLKTK